MKYVWIVAICLFWGHNANAQEVDLMSEEMLLGTSASAQKENPADGAATSVEVQNEESNGFFLNYIIKPISSLFDGGEEYSAEVGSEDLLKESIQQAQDGKIEDQMNLGYMYLYGVNGVQQNFAESFKYYEMAAKQDNPIALNNLGSLYFNGIGTKKDIRTALQLFQRASDLGNDSAAVNLAFIYLSGGTKDDLRNQKAFDLFVKAKEKGNKIAAFMLGYAYYKGFAVSPDYDKAFQLIKEAALGEARIDEAQLVLAEIYMQGLGTVQNYGNALQAYQAAVSQGNTEAYMTLANIYRQGKMVEANGIMAHSLYNIAAAENVDGAAKKRDKIAEKLQREELIKAQELAQEFKAQPSEMTQYIRQTYGKNIRHYIDLNLKTKPQTESVNNEE